MCPFRPSDVSNVLADGLPVEAIEANSRGRRHSSETRSRDKGRIESNERSPDMKAINDLYDSIRKSREARQIYRLARDLPPELRRDIGLYLDHASRRGYRM